MRIGIDYNGVLDNNIRFFRTLVSHLDAEFVVLTVSDQPVEKILHQNGMILEVFQESFDAYSKMPKQKLDLARKAKVDLVLDDLQEIVDYLNKHGINAIRWQK